MRTCLILYTYKGTYTHHLLRHDSCVFINEPQTSSLSTLHKVLRMSLPWHTCSACVHTSSSISLELGGLWMSVKAPATTVHHLRGPWPSLVLLLSPVHAAKCRPAAGRLDNGRRISIWKVDSQWQSKGQCPRMHQASDGCHSAGFPPSKVCVSLKTLTSSRFRASCFILSDLSAPHGSHCMQFSHETNKILQLGNAGKQPSIHLLWLGKLQLHPVH